MWFWTFLLACPAPSPSAPPPDPSEVEVLLPPAPKGATVDPASPLPSLLLPTKGEPVLGVPATGTPWVHVDWRRRWGPTCEALREVAADAPCRPVVLGRASPEGVTGTTVCTAPTPEGPSLRVGVGDSAPTLDGQRGSPQVAKERLDAAAAAGLARRAVLDPGDGTRFLSHVVAAVDFAQAAGATQVYLPDCPDPTDTGPTHGPLFGPVTVQALVGGPTKPLGEGAAVRLTGWEGGYAVHTCGEALFVVGRDGFIARVTETGLTVQRNRERRRVRRLASTCVGDAVAVLYSGASGAPASWLVSPRVELQVWDGGPVAQRTAWALTGRILPTDGVLGVRPDGGLTFDMPDRGGPGGTLLSVGPDGTPLPPQSWRLDVDDNGVLNDLVYDDRGPVMALAHNVGDDRPLQTELRRLGPDGLATLGVALDHRSGHRFVDGTFAWPADGGPSAVLHGIDVTWVVDGVRTAQLDAGRDARAKQLVRIGDTLWAAGNAKQTLYGRARPDAEGIDAWVAPLTPKGPGRVQEAVGPGWVTVHGIGALGGVPVVALFVESTATAPGVTFDRSGLWLWFPEGRGEGTGAAP